MTKRKRNGSLPNVKLATLSIKIAKLDYDRFVYLCQMQERSAQGQVRLMIREFIARNFDKLPGDLADRGAKPHQGELE